MELLVSLLGAMIVPLLVYAFIASMLMRIANQTNTPDAWLAWIPIANLALMCRIAGKPGSWVIGMFVPIVNLFLFAAVWMGIARACGKAPGVGLLVFVPLLGFFVIPYLAFTASPTAAAGPSPASQQMPEPDSPRADSPRAEAPPTEPTATAASVEPTVECPSCLAPCDEGDRFCGECGRDLTVSDVAPMPTSTLRPTSTQTRAAAAVAAPANGSSAALVCAAGIFVGIFLATGGFVGYRFVSGGMGSSAPTWEPQVEKSQVEQPWVDTSQRESFPEQQQRSVVDHHHTGGTQPTASDLQRWEFPIDGSDEVIVIQPRKEEPRMMNPRIINLGGG